MKIKHAVYTGNLTSVPLTNGCIKYISSTKNVCFVLKILLAAHFLASPLVELDRGKIASKCCLNSNYLNLLTVFTCTTKGPMSCAKNKEGSM